MQALGEDLTLAFRHIRSGKAVAAAVVLMIAIGIGANTTIFGLFKATFDQAPFGDMDRLVRIRTSAPGQESTPWVSIPEYVALEEQNRAFDAVGAMDDSVLTVGPTQNGFPAERLIGQRLKLYGVEANDPVAFGGAAGVVVSITLLVSLLPSWRAASTDPIRALRQP